MIDLSATVLQELRTAEPARAPATLGEIWEANWRASGLDTLTGSTGWQRETFEELTGAVEGATGRSLADMVRARGPVSPRSDDELAAIMAEEIDALPDEEQRTRLRSLVDFRGRAASRAQDVERRAAEVGAATYGLAGHATAFLAGMARQAVDPVNAASIFLGGAAGGSVIRFIAREAAIGAGVQAAQEPFIQTNRAGLDLESGWGEAAGNVVEAGAGAAALAGLFRGAAWAYRRLRGGPQPASEAGSPISAGEGAADASGLPAGAAGPARALPDDVRRALDEIDPDDFEAAALVVERDALVARALPADAELAMRGQERLEEAAAAIEFGRPMPGTDELVAEALPLLARLEATRRALADGAPDDVAEIVGLLTRVEETRAARAIGEAGDMAGALSRLAGDDPETAEAMTALGRLAAGARPEGARVPIDDVVAALARLPEMRSAVAEGRADEIGKILVALDRLQPGGASPAAADPVDVAETIAALARLEAARGPRPDTADQVADVVAALARLAPGTAMPPRAAPPLAPDTPEPLVRAVGRVPGHLWARHMEAAAAGRLDGRDVLGRLRADPDHPFFFEDADRLVPASPATVAARLDFALTRALDPTVELDADAILAAAVGAGRSVDELPLRPLSAAATPGEPFGPEVPIPDGDFMAGVAALEARDGGHLVLFDPRFGRVLVPWRVPGEKKGLHQLLKQGRADVVASIPDVIARGDVVAQPSMPDRVRIELDDLRVVLRLDYEPPGSRSPEEMTWVLTAFRMTGRGGPPDGSPPRAGTSLDQTQSSGPPAGRSVGGATPSAKPAEGPDPAALAADTARLLEEAGGDMEIELPTADGFVRVSLRAALAEAEADAAAARELQACIIGAAT